MVRPLLEGNAPDRADLGPIPGLKVGHRFKCALGVPQGNHASQEHLIEAFLRCLLDRLAKRINALRKATQA